MTSTLAQEITVFPTYQDFVDQKGIDHELYKGYTSKRNNFLLEVKNGKKKSKLSAKEFWGFTYKDALFRVHRDDNQPARILSAGKIFYYENGAAHLNMLRYQSTSGAMGFGHYCYVSKDINSKIIPMPKMLGSKSDINNFKAENPQYKELFDCIEKKYDYRNVRPCVLEFQGEE